MGGKEATAIAAAASGMGIPLMGLVPVGDLPIRASVFVSFSSVSDSSCSISSIIMVAFYGNTCESEG